ncbi:cholinesterase [Tetranychus urticae]|uniref:Carboxylesterase type B domain-containing protein n=1 Tax=Tetranychus urticae TaxID=32264 RepID=T1JX44_TETUR|nr:cholinesterase [Tetranychus urticae]
MCWTYFKCLLICLTITTIKCEQQNPLIKTESCVYKGSVGQSNGVTLLSWKGIRYGQPPIGDLRFKPPQPTICTNNKIIDATVSTNLCPQLLLQPLMSGNVIRNGINMSEDCLQLSIWVPLLSDEKATKTLPYRTLIVLPGGNFETNLLVDKDFDDGSVLAARGGIIVVTVQHRLGVLGFTYTDNPETPGNLGLLDQSLALQWIKSNIVFFGGDPSLLTIYGQGSGSLSSVIVNILNPQPSSPNNLNRFILSSGFPVPGACEDKATAFQRFVWLSEQVGCQPTSYSIETGTMLSCLRSLPFETLLKGQATLNSRLSTVSSGLFQVTTKPTAGTSNFPKCIYDLNDAQVSKRGLNILMLNMEDEGSTYLSPSRSIEGLAPSPKGDDILSYVRFIENQTLLFMGQPIELLETIVPLYYSELLDGYEVGLKESLVQLVGDRLVYCPSHLSGLSFASSGSTVHQGLITYTPTVNYFKGDVNKYGNIFDSTFGARTGLDYWLIMGKPYLDPSSSDQDKWMSNELIRLVSDFVKTEEIPWPPLLPLSNEQVVPFEYDLDIKNPYKPLRKSDRYFDCKSWKPFIWPGNVSPTK